MYRQLLYTTVFPINESIAILKMDGEDLNRRVSKMKFGNLFVRSDDCQILRHGSATMNT